MISNYSYLGRMIYFLIHFDLIRFEREEYYEKQLVNQTSLLLKFTWIKLEAIDSGQNLKQLIHID